MANHFTGLGIGQQLIWLVPLPLDVQLWDMATRIISPHPQALSALSLPSKFSSRNGSHLHQHQPWLGRAPPTHLRPGRQLLARLSLQQTLLSSSSALSDHLQNYHQNPDSMYLLAESAGYSLASYYTSLGLFVISVPGLWSLIKRSVKSKVS